MSQKVSVIFKNEGQFELIKFFNKQFDHADPELAKEFKNVFVTTPAKSTDRVKGCVKFRWPKMKEKELGILLASLIVIDPSLFICKCFKSGFTVGKLDPENTGLSLD